MTVIPGDLVMIAGSATETTYVVVDLDGGEPPYAVLREPDDLPGQRLIAAPAASLTVIGHLDQVEGWLQEAPGRWRPA